jgi:hypothetical protein
MADPDADWTGDFLTPRRLSTEQLVRLKTGVRRWQFKAAWEGCHS